MRLWGREDIGEDIPAGFLAREDPPGPRTVQRKGLGARAAAMVTAALVLLGALAAADYALNSGKVHRGVSAGDVDLGGMSRAEARETLRLRADKMAEISLTGREQTISAAGIRLRLDAAETVERAYSVGRGDSLAGQVRERLRATLGGSGIEPALNYDRAALRAEVKRIAGGTGTPESGLRLTGSGVELAGEGRVNVVDVEATVRSVERSLAELDPEARLVEAGGGLGAAERGRAEERAARAVEEPLVLAAGDAAGDGRWTLSRERVAASLRLSDENVVVDREALGRELAASLASLERPPVEARMVSTGEGTVEVEPSESGVEVRMQRLVDEIGAGLFEGRHRYEVPVSTVEPQLTTAEAEAARPNTMLGEFRTDYRVYDQPPRVENLKTASGAVDGTILAPGETFSFNAAAAPLARYEPSDVIVNGRIDTALGGGLCQVASTLYMAANYAGLDIVERHPHYAELPYIRPGFDATVWFGALDLKLRNNTGDYLLLEEKVDEETGEVVSRVYGQPTGREVEMASSKLSETGGTSRWRATREVVEDGRVIESGPISADTYQPLQPAAPAPTGRGA